MSNYPDEVTDLYLMNRVQRHRLRNHCAGMKMTLESLMTKDPEKLVAAFASRAPLMIKEIDHLLNYTHKMDQVFDHLKEPQPAAFQHLLEQLQTWFATAFPLVDLELDGESLEGTIPAANHLQLALEALLSNAAEGAMGEKVVKMVWQFSENRLEFAIINPGTWPETIPCDPPIPFNTTRGGVHDGLGLATAWRLVETLGGSMTIFTELDDLVAVKVEQIPMNEVKHV